MSLSRKYFLLVPALAVICCFMLSTIVIAQGSLSLGTVDTPTTGACNTSDGWYYYTDPSGTQHYLNCLQTTVRNCANASDWPLTYGYLSPANIVPNTPKAKGTIVFFSGDGGVLSSISGNFGYADAYFKAGYEIVQLAWNNDWEYTYDPFVGSEKASIQNAACRPATFLNYAYNNIFSGVQSQYATAGFCSHAASAGSAAVAYSMAYYGAGAWLDNVELISGPVFSDINQGCEVPGPPAHVVVCGQTNYNGGQWGCQLVAAALPGS